VFHSNLYYRIATVVSIRYYPVQEKKVYNLTVENDNDFFAGGILVHNCDCVDLPVMKPPEEVRKDIFDKYFGEDAMKNPPPKYEPPKHILANPDDTTGIPNPVGRKDNPSKIPEPKTKVAPLKPDYISYKTGHDTYFTGRTVDEKFAFTGLNEKDLVQLDANTRTDIVNEVERIYTELPQTKGAITKISVNNRISKNTYAQTKMNLATHENEVGLGGKNYKDIQALQKQYEKDVEEKYHPQGTTYKSIITHETGHAITNKIIEMQKTVYSNYANLCEDIQKKVLEKLKLKNDQTIITNNLSGYGAKKPAEFVAEAYAEYMDSPNPRPIAKEVGNMIKILLTGGRI
jgi:hypothetical protein